MATFRNRLLRKRVEERDQGICARCGVYDAKWQHDHIQELWEGGADTLENSQTLCRRHHLEKSVGSTPIRAKTDRLKARADLTKARRAIR
jgi:5-methylcytosine-specific restriction endonuclease McrA